MNKNNYYSIKCKLKNILKFPEILSLIQDKVNAVNKLWNESYFFFNLVLLNAFSENFELNFDENTINRCILLILDKNIRKKNNGFGSIEIEKLLNEIKFDENNFKIIKESNNDIQDIINTPSQKTYIKKQIKIME